MSTTEETPGGVNAANAGGDGGGGPGGSDEATMAPGYNGSMSNYCKSLESWLWQSYWHREVAVSAYYSALSILYPPSNQFSSYSTTNTSTGGVMFNNNNNNNNYARFIAGIAQQQQGQGAAAGGGGGIGQRPPIVRQILIRGIRVNGAPLGIDFNLAPVWKRILAECIDFAILLIVKIFITVSIIDAFDLFDLDNIDLDALQDSEALLEMAYSLSITQLLLLELTHRLIVCIFEAYCLYKGGATPGKNMMGLRVLHCESIFPIGPNINNNQDYLYAAAAAGAANGFGGGRGQQGVVAPSRVIVAPGTLLSFQRAFLRSAIKNFSLAFFFPFCFTLFHFEYSRTLYDLSARSIVIELQRVPNNNNNN